MPAESFKNAPIFSILYAYARETFLISSPYPKKSTLLILCCLSNRCENKNDIHCYNNGPLLSLKNGKREE